jgi:hypothetical protein
VIDGDNQSVIAQPSVALLAEVNIVKTRNSIRVKTSRPQVSTSRVVVFQSIHTLHSAGPLSHKIGNVYFDSGSHHGCETITTFHHIVQLDPTIISAQAVVIKAVSEMKLLTTEFVFNAEPVVYIKPKTGICTKWTADNIILS